jgi:hypothetical protein
MELKKLHQLQQHQMIESFDIVGSNQWNNYDSNNLSGEEIDISV